MKNYKNNKYYLSLIAIFSLLVTTNLYALESKPLNSDISFSAELKNKKLDDKQSVEPVELASDKQPVELASDKEPVELASDNSYNAQPVVHVEDTSVEESTAEKMRKRREEAEVRTEQKIAESLERARLADEKRRAERLFGNKIQPANSPIAPNVQQAPKNNSRLNAIENSLSEIKTNLFNQDFNKIQQNSGRYVGLDLGTGKYIMKSSSGDTVTTKSVFGISTGMRVEDNPFITLEGHFLFSQHLYKDNNYNNNEDYYYYPQVKQYNAGLALKYDIVPFVITPRLGASIDYTFRQYSMESDYENSSQKLDTHSVDVALIAGGYIQVSRYLGIEISYRQMMNVSTSARNNLYNPDSSVGNSSVNLLDKATYSLFIISLQMGFQ